MGEFKLNIKICLQMHMFSDMDKFFGGTMYNISMVCHWYTSHYIQMFIGWCDNVLAQCVTQPATQTITRTHTHTTNRNRYSNPNAFAGLLSYRRLNLFEMVFVWLIDESSQRLVFGRFCVMWCCDENATTELSPTLVSQRNVLDYVIGVGSYFTYRAHEYHNSTQLSSEFNKRIIIHTYIRRLKILCVYFCPNIV